MINDETKRLVLTDPAFSAGYKLTIIAIRTRITALESDLHYASGAEEGERILFAVEQLETVLRELGSSMQR